MRRLSEQRGTGSVRWISCAVISLTIAATVSCNRPPPTYELSETQVSLDLPAGLPEIIQPPDNLATKEKIALGKRLFFDKNLSLDRSISCADCHDPEKFWSNGLQYGVGVGGKQGTRNVPSLSNVAYQRQLFWDGRSGSLEGQAIKPMLNPDEMAMPSAEAVLERLEEDSEYGPLFGKAFEDGISLTNMACALACYQRTLLSGNSPYDRYMAGDKKALSEAAVRGLKVFNGRGKCKDCHTPPLFVDNAYHNLGVGMDQKDPDLGRYEVFKLKESKGRFKTPPLRDIALTAPYMHDGSMKTLMETVELYDQGGISNPWLNRDVRRKLRLTDQEKKDLVTFMIEGLTSDDKAQR